MATAALDPAIAAVLKRPFPEQVAFFRGKLGRLVPTQTWRDLWQAEHDKAFMVAGAAKADLLADLAAAVDQALFEGGTIETFRRNFDATVARHGWDFNGGRDWRTRVIYNTNAATSYAAGRLAQLQHSPFWVYKHNDSVLHPRPLHLSWDGLVLPRQHKFWKTHYPPNGWGCRCRAFGVSDPALARKLGGDPDKTLPGNWQKIDPKTGAPVGIDEGWAFQPGNTAIDTVQQSVAAKTIAWRYELAKAYMSAVPPALRDALATAQRGLPETGAAARRYAEGALGERNGVPIQLPIDLPPNQTLGLLTSAEANRIAGLSGVARLREELFDWTIDRSAVNKIRKDHGDDKAEALSGQTAVVVGDYALLPRIIAQADRIEAAGVTDIGRPAVRVIAQINGLEYVAVFEVRAQRRMLGLQSMWKRGRPPSLRP